MQELLPIALGLMLGLALGFVRPSLRIPAGAALATALGVLVTVATGEFAISPAYLLIDIPLVAAASLIGLAAGRRLTPVSA